MSQAKPKIQPATKSKTVSTIIIGWNSIAKNSLDKLSTQSYYNVIGFLNTDNMGTNGDLEYKGVRVIGKISDLQKIMVKYNIAYAFIALDPMDYKEIHRVVLICKKYNLQYNMVSELYDIVFGHTIQQVFKDIQRPIEISFRRFMDIILSAIALLMFLPLWSIIALAIKLNSKGTVLYSQERVGKGGQIFRIFKFRTMVSDAEKLSGPVLASKRDPRITKVGAFLRKTRMDELPQLLNVLIGHMSIIGPRPERPYFVEKYSREIPMYKNRLRMKPGITGLAQITVGYDQDIEDVRNKLKHDLIYLDNYSSLSLNFKIIFKTLWVVFTGQGQ